jgi:hypothetical protein
VKVRAGEFAAEAVRGEAQRQRLAADRGGGKVDRQRHLQSGFSLGGGTQFGEGVPFRHPHRAADFDMGAGRRLFDDAGTVEQKDEGGGGTVQDGNFGPVQLDQRVVDAQSR